LSELDDSDLNDAYAAFVAGDRRAGGALFAKTKEPILVAIRARAGDLHHDHDDILDEVFVILLEAPSRYHPAQGPILSFIKAVLVPEAIRRIRAKSARPGQKTRRRVVAQASTGATFPMPDRVPDPESVPCTGEGSPEAIEAACDIHAICARANQPLRDIIGGLMDGKTQSEISADTGMSRFRVMRLISGLQRQLTAG
jgi:DNA-directed RNA polymerase specialized sigma24 family protein